MSNTIKTVTDLKSIWISGYKPSQSDFSDLFTTLVANTSGSSDVNITSSTGVVMVNGNKVITDNLTSSIVIAYTPVNTGNISGSTVIDYSIGNFQQVVLTDSSSLMPPINGTNGARLELWLKATGSNQELSLDAAIVIPSDSSVSFPKTLTMDKTYIMLLRQATDGSTCWLSSLVGGF
jgi:hypothetical protein